MFRHISVPSARPMALKTKRDFCGSGCRSRDGDSCLWAAQSAMTRFCQLRAAETAFLRLPGYTGNQAGSGSGGGGGGSGGGSVTLSSPRSLGRGSALVSSAQQVEGSVFLETGQELEPEFKL